VVKSTDAEATFY